jgi:hypothetical protein
VLIDGQPLKYGVVRFLPAHARSSGGTLDKNGHFTLTCFEPGDGAVIGMHGVEVSGAEAITDYSVKWHAPKKYANYRTSGLQQEIKGATDSVVISLSWDGGKPFVETDESAAADSVAGKMKK